MTIKDLSSKLDKVFLGFKEAKENHKDNKVYKKQLEDFAKETKEIEKLLIDKQQNDFFDKENKEYHETMKILFDDAFFALKECQDTNKKKELLELTVLAKEQKEKTYMMVANTYSQFFQMINGIKQQLAQELNVVNTALTQKKS